MLEMYRKTRIFQLGYLFFLLLGAWILLSFPKGSLEKWINRHYTNATADLFFKYFTFVGDGLFYILVGLILFYFNRQRGLIALVCFVVVGISAQLLKNLVFSGVPRPLGFFGTEAGLHLVQGITIHKFGSFPSGHSATAFSMFFLLALYSGRPAIQFLCLFSAVLTAFSRVYLMQHFFMDIYFGSMIGLVLTILIRYWISSRGILEKGKLKVP